MDLSKQIRRIAVIGAGPAGLAAVKYVILLMIRRNGCLFIS
jgi:cation diffusion facilitator CzcD-associated flavoprotein CzcO